ncbi:MAG: hypothetical protein AAB316_04220, partial [Bacteroidota bacterium]
SRTASLALGIREARRLAMDLPLNHNQKLIAMKYQIGHPVTSYAPGTAAFFAFIPGKSVKPLPP